MNDVHVLPHENRANEDHLVRDKATAHSGKKKRIHPNDAGVDSTNVVKANQIIKRKPRNDPD